MDIRMDKCKRSTALELAGGNRAQGLHFSLKRITPSARHHHLVAILAQHLSYCRWLATDNGEKVRLEISGNLLNMTMMHQCIMTMFIALHHSTG